MLYSDIPEKTRMRMEQLHALSKQGVGGEALNASEFLSDLLRKNGISLEQFLSTDDREIHIIKVPRGSYYGTLLLAIAARVFNYDHAREVDISSYVKFNGTFELNCSVGEFTQIKVEFDIYKKAYKSQFETFKRAFLQSNNLLIERSFFGKRANHEPSQEDIDKAQVAAEMASGMRAAEIQKRLT